MARRGRGEGLGAAVRVEDAAGHLTDVLGQAGVTDPLTCLVQQLAPDLRWRASTPTPASERDTGKGAECSAGKKSRSSDRHGAEARRRRRSVSGARTPAMRAGRLRRSSPPAGGRTTRGAHARVEPQTNAGIFGWKRLEQLEAAVAWRRDPDNSALANVWHLETLADLADALRKLLSQREIDEKLIALLWEHVPGDDRVEIAQILEAPGSRHPGGAARLAWIVDPKR